VLKHAGERPPQHRQGLCAACRVLFLSLKALTLTSRKNGFQRSKRTVPVVRTAFWRCQNSYLLNNGKWNKKQKIKRGLRPRCCAVRPHSKKKRSSTKKLDSSSSRRLLAENRNKHRSAPKRKAEDATHLLLIIYPRCEANSWCIMIACQCALARCSYTRSRLASLAKFLFVGLSDVRRTWPTEWELSCS